MSIFILQMDVSAFRLLWDKSTAQCYVIEEARKKKEDKNVTQIYYWEVNWWVMLFPRICLLLKVVKINWEMSELQ